jgi:ribose 5-phosphate isomerase A
MDSDSLKRAAAARALDFVQPGMRLGLGSGSTAREFVALLGERVRAGLDIVGVPTSEETRAQAEDLGIRLATLDEVPELDLTIDGADEIAHDLALIKGGGGALLREKVVASSASRFVVVAEVEKRVERLGERFRLPVEIVRFGWRDTRRRLAAYLPDAERRAVGDEPYQTDEGHYILDCALGPDADPDALNVQVKQIPGVVDHGLFLGMAERVLLGRRDGGVDVLGAA